jgi:DNA ligase-1
MGDLADGESVEMQGSAKTPYVLQNVAGAYSCTCPAWLHQSRPTDLRTCKHLKKLRGTEAEVARIGADALRGAVKKDKAGDAVKPPVLLAHNWEPKTDPTGWWISEKLDGVRAYWDGAQFVSRLGNRYLAPGWFTAGLPTSKLDGELWVGRKKFQETISIVRRAKANELWKSVTYVVFDAPDEDGPFEARMEGLRELIKATNGYATLIENTVCTSLAHMQSELARVEKLGGEGLMLRQAKSRYVSGRSTTLLKVKTFHDAEAKVVGYVAGKGKHKGTVGSLTAVTPGGIQFNVGTGLKDAERKNPPGIGSVITYRYQELTKAGVPRFPTYLRERPDAEWPPGDAPPKKKAKKAKKKAQKKAKKKVEKEAQSAEAVAGPVRYFEFNSGTSNKFWEITMDGSTFWVRYGRIGSEGQRRAKVYGDVATATAAAEKLVSQKTGKGYTETVT